MTDAAFALLAEAAYEGELWEHDHEASLPEVAALCRAGLLVEVDGWYPRCFTISDRGRALLAHYRGEGPLRPPGETTSLSDALGRGRT